MEAEVLPEMVSEKEKFRSYLESGGVITALTDALVKLYEEPEKPGDALEYLKKILSVSSGDSEKIDLLQEKIKQLESENKYLKSQLSKYEPQSEDPLHIPSSDLESSAKAVEQDQLPTG